MHPRWCDSAVSVIADSNLAKCLVLNDSLALVYHVDRTVDPQSVYYVSSYLCHWRMQYTSNLYGLLSKLTYVPYISGIFSCVNKSAFQKGLNCQFHFSCVIRVFRNCNYDALWRSFMLRQWKKGHWSCCTEDWLTSYIWQKSRLSFHSSWARLSS